MTRLEMAQKEMARALASKAINSSPKAALDEFGPTGLEPRDLGKWSYIPAQSLVRSVGADEPIPPDCIDGSVELFDSSDRPESISDAAHMLHRARFSFDLSARLASAVSEIEAGGDPATVSEVVLRAISGIRDGRSYNRGDRALTMELPALAESIEKGGSMARPVPTGIASIDSVIYGWQPTLNLIGADPGVGKSALIGRSALNGARGGRKSAIFSLEDPPRAMAARMVSNISRVEVLRILYARLTEAELALVEQGLEDLGRVSDNIVVYDGSERAMAVERLCSIARSLISSSGVQCIYVDHAGELRSIERDRHDLEVASQLSSLRGLANSTGVPVVVAMHMRRRLNTKPTLADFANSSGAERKARVAVALTREPGANIMQAHILKQTNGPSGITVDVPFDLISGMVA